MSQHGGRSAGIVTLAAVVGFLAVLALEGIVFTTPPASSYEISLFSAYPWYFWALAVGTLVLGQAIIVRAAFATGDDSSRWWFGLLLVLAVEAILLLIPYFRGYPVFGRGDVLTHVGFVKSIAETGVVGPKNIYPNLHLVVLSLSYASGIPPIHVINSLAVAISLFFVVASYALVATIYDRRRALITLPFVTLLIGGTAHVNPSPFVMSSLLVPFVLYLFAKERETQALPVRAGLALVLVATVLYHPITTIFLLFVFGLYGGVRFLTARELLGTRRRTAGPVIGTNSASRLTIAVFVSWYYNFANIILRFETVVDRLLFAESGESTLQSYSSTLSRASPPLVDLARIAFVKYGVALVVLPLAGLYSVGLVVSWARSRLDASVYQLTFAAAFVLFSGLSVVFLVADLIVGFGRPLLYARLFGALVAGSLFYGLASRPSGRTGMRAALYVVVALLVVFSTVGLYYSPLGGSSNHQVTEAELDGSEWFLDHWDADRPLLQYGIELDRFRDAIYGVRGWSDAKLIPASTTSNPPDHFTYDRRQSFGSRYESDRYLVVTRAGRVFYPEVYPQYQPFWRFTSSDFDRLERDPTVAQVYDNGGFDAYVVNGTNTTDDTASRVSDGSAPSSLTAPSTGSSTTSSAPYTPA